MNARTLTTINNIAWLATAMGFVVMAYLKLDSLHSFWFLAIYILGHQNIKYKRIVEVLKELRDDIDVVSRNTDALERGDREAWLRHHAYFEGIDFALAKIDALIKERGQRPKH